MVTKTLPKNGLVADAIEAVAAAPIRISAPNFERIFLDISGTTPLLMNAFSAKAKTKMALAQAAGQQSRTRKVRDPRDFDADYQAAFHRDEQGRQGIPAAAFRNAAIDACRLVGYRMTYAKLSIFIEHDALDVNDGSPLVWFSGTPEKSEMMGRNATGVTDIRVRPMWRQWSATLRVRFDADQFSLNDVVNLIDRAGQQVGVGEGRPGSRMSNGIGMGCFEVVRS
jgi:hypothetical protein